MELDKETADEASTSELKSSKEQEQDSSYFESYDDVDVHRLMLQDTVRTTAYMNAICNTDLFKGKVVMDVGAGTGILSLFAAKAGAKEVLAVEASDMALILPKIAAKNGYETIIKVFHSKVEDMTLDVKVDIIVSEWMGFYALHESMLDSVIFARDKFLNPDTGLLFPSNVQIFAAPCRVPELWKNQSAFWKESQYGFDLSPMVDKAKMRTKPEIFTVEGTDLLSDPQMLWDFKLKEIKLTDLTSLSDRRFFSIEEDGQMQAVCLWFTCSFPTLSDTEEITLSTAPWDPETHWKQTVILLPDEVETEGGDIVGWQIGLDKVISVDGMESNKRSYRISLRFLDDDEEHPVPCLCGSVKCEIVRYYIQNEEKKGMEDC